MGLLTFDLIFDLGHCHFAGVMVRAIEKDNTNRDEVLSIYMKHVYLYDSREKTTGSTYFVN